MQASYWLLTHPVNNFWLKNAELKGTGKAFFSTDPLNRIDNLRALDWTKLRDRWELSHVVRAAFGLASLICLVTAMTVSGTVSNL